MGCPSSKSYLIEKIVEEIHSTGTFAASLNTQAFFDPVVSRLETAMIPYYAVYEDRYRSGYNAGNIYGRTAHWVGKNLARSYSFQKMIVDGYAYGWDTAVPAVLINGLVVQLYDQYSASNWVDFFGNSYIAGTPVWKYPSLANDLKAFSMIWHSINGNEYNGYGGTYWPEAWDEFIGLYPDSYERITLNYTQAAVWEAQFLTTPSQLQVLAKDDNDILFADTGYFTISATTYEFKDRYFTDAGHYAWHGEFKAR